MTISNSDEIKGDGILRCRDIELAFGGLRALKGVSLEIAKGQIFGLVGPNGSGKTSMVNVITGFYRPQSGSVNLFGARSGRAQAAPHRGAGRGAHVPKSRFVSRHDRSRKHPARPSCAFMGASALASLFYWVWALRNERPIVASSKS